MRWRRPIRNFRERHPAITRLMVALVILAPSVGLVAAAIWPVLERSISPCDGNVIQGIPLYSSDLQTSRTQEMDKYFGCPRGKISIVTTSNPSDIEQFYTGWLFTHGWQSLLPCPGFKRKIKGMPYLAFIRITSKVNAPATVELEIGPGMLSCDYDMGP